MEHYSLEIPYILFIVLIYPKGEAWYLYAVCSLGRKWCHSNCKGEATCNNSMLLHLSTLIQICDTRASKAMDPVNNKEL